MGGAASSEKGRLHVENTPLRDRPQAVLLVNGLTKRGGKVKYRHTTSSRGASSGSSAMGRVGYRPKRVESSNDEEVQAMRAEADPATLQILNAVREADSLPNDRASLRLQLLRDCYPLLEQVPTHRFDNLAVLVYQKEGDVYLSQGDTESAKTTYSRAIQIAETRVARGEKEIYMVLKRYVLAMVGMARLWYEQERATTGFRFANKTLPSIAPAEESQRSLLSRESSVISEASVFSLNQEILNAMAPKVLRRRAGPTVRVVRLLQPTTTKQEFTDEDDFVLRSQMTRELKASPCELLLLRCIEVVEIGHRRQSELLIPALTELAEIYEDLQLFNRSLLLVRRCLGILSVVYDYDHPWIIQLRHRADYLMERIEEKMKEVMATKIKATWKMYRAMQVLEETLGRPVRRHVWIPTRYHEKSPDSDFLKEFVNDLPDGTVFSGIDNWDEYLGVPVEEEGKEIPSDLRGTNDDPVSPTEVLSDNSYAQSSDSKKGSLRMSLRRSTMTMSGSVESAALSEEAHQPLPSLPPLHPKTQHESQPTVSEKYISDGRAFSSLEIAPPDTHTQQTARGDAFTIRTTTTTRTIVKKDVGENKKKYINDEEDKFVELINGGKQVVTTLKDLKTESYDVNSPKENETRLIPP